jgi:hypothetical protein
MSSISGRSAAVLALTALLLLSLCACSSSGPKPVQPGTPQFFWGAARETFRNGDYTKTSENLQNILRSDNEFRLKAYPWALMMTSGMAQGYMDYAEHQDLGAISNRNNPAGFRREASVARNAASTLSIQFAETFRKFRTEVKDVELGIPFDFPSGSLAEPPAADKIAKGMVLQPSELESIRSALIKRGVLNSLCSLMGTPKDSAKALDLFKKPEPKLSREAVMTASANMLWDMAQLFGPKQLDSPQKVKALSDEAMQALNAAPQSKQSKELATKIQANLKKLKIT